MIKDVQSFNSLDEVLNRDVSLETVRSGSKNNGDYWMPAIIAGNYYIINYSLDIDEKLSYKNFILLVSSDQ